MSIKNPFTKFAAVTAIVLTSGCAVGPTATDKNVTTPTCAGLKSYEGARLGAALGRAAGSILTSGIQRQPYLRTGVNTAAATVGRALGRNSVGPGC